MSRNHNRTRRASYKPRLDNLREKPRSFSPEGEPTNTIGLWGEGVMGRPQEPRLQTSGDLVPGIGYSVGPSKTPLPSSVPKPDLPLTGGAKERPPSS